MYMHIDDEGRAVMKIDIDKLVRVDGTGSMGWAEADVQAAIARAERQDPSEERDREIAYLRTLLAR